MCEDMLKDETRVRELLQKDPDLFDRIYEFINKALDSFRAIVKNDRGDIEATRLIRDIEATRDMWYGLLEENRGREATAEAEQESLIHTKDGEVVVEIEEDILDGVPENEIGAVVRREMKKRFPNGITIKNNKIIVNSDSRGEITSNNATYAMRRKNDPAYKDRFRAVANADEIVQNSYNWESVELNAKHDPKAVDFGKGRARIRISPKNDYEITVETKTFKDGRTILYDLEEFDTRNWDIKEETYGQGIGPGKTGEHSNSESVSSTNIIPNTEDSVNSNQRETENRGTEAQENESNPGSETENEFDRDLWYELRDVWREAYPSDQDQDYESVYEDLIEESERWGRSREDRDIYDGIIEQYGSIEERARQLAERTVREAKERQARWDAFEARARELHRAGEDYRQAAEHAYRELTEEQTNKVPDAADPDVSAEQLAESVENKKNKEDDDSEKIVHLKDQIRNKMQDLSKMEPIVKIFNNGIEGRRKSDRIKEILLQFEKYGYKVNRAGLGDVEIGKRQVARAINYAQTDAEYACIFAAPEIIKNGI